MSTVKQVIDAALGRMNLPQSSTYVGSSAPGDIQCVQILKEIGDKMRNMALQWPQLKRAYTFTVSEGVVSYSAPGDFYRALDTTAWDLTNKWPIQGPISDFHFGMRSRSVAMSLQTRKAYRMFGAIGHALVTLPWTKRCSAQFEIDPPPTSADNLYLEYMTCNWVMPKDWTASTEYSAGDLVSAAGQIYRAREGGTSGGTRPNGTDGCSDGVLTWDLYYEPYDWTAGSDDDFCLFDDDLLIDGFRWAFKREKGLEYSEQRHDWEMACRNAVGRFGGTVRINAADEFGDGFEFPNLPSQNWNVGVR